MGFLVKKEANERKVYYKVFRILMAFSFGGPFVGSWYRAYEGAANAFSYSKFFLATGVLLFISSFATFVSYRFNLRKIQRDIRYRRKIIDTTYITRKVYIEQNNTCYFYLNSLIKLSIEVTPIDFQNFNEGDELSIEYAAESKEYFGYF